MAGKTIIAAAFTIFFIATGAWAFGGGGGGGGGVSMGSPPIDLLMPDPPRNVTATAGNGSATVSFSVPEIRRGEPDNLLYG